MLIILFFFFFFNDTATTEIYTLSLHDALPIWSSTSPRPNGTRSTSAGRRRSPGTPRRWYSSARSCRRPPAGKRSRSEEHTSELQSRQYLVCRLLLEKKKKKKKNYVDTKL